MVAQKLGAELSKSDLYFIKSLNPSPQTSTQKERCAFFGEKNKAKQNVGYFPLRFYIHILYFHNLYVLFVYYINNMYHMYIIFISYIYNMK